MLITLLFSATDNSETSKLIDLNASTPSTPNKRPHVGYKIPFMDLCGL